MAYKPSIWRVSKYYKYLLYQLEYLLRADFVSIFQSIRYVLFQTLPTKSRVITTKMGKFFLREKTSDFQFVNMTYETKVKKYILKNLHQIGLFLDVGACIGEYCVWISRYGIPTVAIEPVNSDSIMVNAYLNNVNKKITIIACAVGNEEGMVDFVVEKEVTGSSCLSKTNSEGNIPIHKIDNLVGLYNIEIPTDKMTLMKLDIEGMEPEALKGAEHFIKSTKNLQIIYEYYDNQDQKIKEVLNSFCKFEYTDLDGVNMLAVKLK